MHLTNLVCIAIILGMATSHNSSNARFIVLVDPISFGRAVSGMDFYSLLIGWTIRLLRQCGEVPLPNNIWHSYMIAKLANSDCKIEQGGGDSDE